MSDTDSSRKKRLAKKGIPDLSERLKKLAEEKAAKRVAKLESQSERLREMSKMVEMKNAAGNLGRWNIPTKAYQQLDKVQKKYGKFLANKYPDISQADLIQKKLGHPPLGALDWAEKKLKIESDLLKKVEEKVAANKKAAELAAKETAKKEMTKKALSTAGKAAKGLGAILTISDLLESEPGHTDEQEMEEIKKYRQQQKDEDEQE